MALRGKTKEIRCAGCNKLLAIENLRTAIFELKCLRCGQINSVLNRSDYLVFVTDQDGHIVFINENVKKITGYSAKEVLGKTPSVWGGQMPSKFYKDLWRNILNKKRAVSLTLTNRKKSGALYKVRESISPILNEQGDVAFFFATQRLLKLL